MKFPANDLWGNREPVCPYCAHKQDASDMSGYDEEELETECESCSKKFDVKKIISVEYSTVGDCKLNGEMPHHLVKWKDSPGPFRCTKCQGEAYEWELEGGQYPRYKKDEYTVEIKSHAGVI